MVDLEIEALYHISSEEYYEAMAGYEKWQAELNEALAEEAEEV